MFLHLDAGCDAGTYLDADSGEVVAGTSVPAHFNEPTFCDYCSEVGSSNEAGSSCFAIDPDYNGNCTPPSCISRLQMLVFDQPVPKLRTQLTHYGTLFLGPIY